MAIAGPLADPDEITEQFRQKLKDTFPEHRPKLTAKNLPFAKYSAMRLRRVPMRDVLDEYMQDHPKTFRGDPHTPENRSLKRKLRRDMKQFVKRHILTFESMIGDKNS